jgi:hypothetical protein
MHGGQTGARLNREVPGFAQVVWLAGVVLSVREAGGRGQVWAGAGWRGRAGLVPGWGVARSGLW